MLNLILSLLVHKELLTEEEAEHLSKQMLTSMQPQAFDESHALVTKMLKEFKDSRKNS